MKSLENHSGKPIGCSKNFWENLVQRPIPSHTSEEYVSQPSKIPLAEILGSARSMWYT